MPKLVDQLDSCMKRMIQSTKTWIVNLLRSEFLACTRGSVGAENGLGPEREGRGAAWVGFFKASFVSKTGAVPCKERCSCLYDAF